MSKLELFIRASPLFSAERGHGSGMLLFQRLKIEGQLLISEGGREEKGEQQAGRMEREVQEP